MTRRLVASGQRPVTVGTFFSLGHSTYGNPDISLVPVATSTYFPPKTKNKDKKPPNKKKGQGVPFPISLTNCVCHSIVIITSIVVAATASAISDRFGTFSRTGGIIGTSVSAGFLIVLGIVNIYICFKLVQQMKRLIRSSPGEVGIVLLSRRVLLMTEL